MVLLYNRFMQLNSYKNYIIVLVLLVIVAGISFFAKRGQVPTPEGVGIPTSEENQNVGTPKEESKVENIAPTYKELIAAGHELYKKEKYMEALVYFKKAEKIEQNYSIYRSIYSAYLGLKDYANAEISIKKVVDLSRGIPNNWLEYASFEYYSMKASFEVVSKIYEDALKATKDNINVITAYAAYLVENQKYEQAITYLEKAITIDPARKAVFQAEIDYLRDKDGP